MGVFRMPSLGSDMEAGKLVEWLVAPGDQVRRGDVIAVVETQKGAIEVEIFETGEVSRLLLGVGATVPVGTAMAEIGVVAATAPEPTPATPILAAPAPAPKPAPAAAPHGQPPSSPAARMLARDRAMALDGIDGSGPDGAVLLRDVAAAKPASFGPRDMRSAIAAAMSRSKREIPYFYLSHEIDLHPATDWLAARNAGRPPEARLVMGLLLIRAAALAARKHPALNGTYQHGAFRPAARVHPGVAVSLRAAG
ncbi:MAG: pyruvate dehydrogenase E2 component (dihydrolipoamide acetyltransferase) [Paracoccaceae bacterium]|jgi:pyruvate dehydrogenase E2 component (dihydrolipoamide acetyltransferase)